MTADILFHKRQIQRCFNRAVNSYDDHANLQYQVGLELIHQTTRFLVSPEKIVDVGAGTGSLSMELKKHYPHSALYCVDLSTAMLNRCRERLINHLISADFDALPFNNHCFDFIYSNMTLQWSFDLFETFCELLRCLRPRGIFSFTLMMKDTLMEFSDQLNLNFMHPFAQVNEFLLSLPISILFSQQKKYEKKYRSLYEVQQFFKKTGSNYLLPNMNRHKVGYQEILAPFAEEKIGEFKIGIFVVQKN